MGQSWGVFFRDLMRATRAGCVIFLFTVGATLGGLFMMVYALLFRPSAPTVVTADNIETVEQGDWVRFEGAEILLDAAANRLAAKGTTVVRGYIDIPIRPNFEQGNRKFLLVSDDSTYRGLVERGIHGEKSDKKLWKKYKDDFRKTRDIQGKITAVRKSNIYLREEDPPSFMMGLASFLLGIVCSSLIFLFVKGKQKPEQPSMEAPE